MPLSPIIVSAKPHILYNVERFPETETCLLVSNSVESGRVAKLWLLVLHDVWVEPNYVRAWEVEICV